MKQGDRVEIPSIPEIPALRDSTRRYLGQIIGFYEESVLVALDHPIILDARLIPVVRVPALLPIPVSSRLLGEQGRAEIDVRHLCATNGCMRAPSVLMTFSTSWSLYCDECARDHENSVHFVEARTLHAIKELAPPFAQAARNLLMHLHNGWWNDPETIRQFLLGFAEHVLWHSIPASGSSILEYRGHTIEEIARMLPDLPDDSLPTHAPDGDSVTV